MALDPYTRLLISIVFGIVVLFMDMARFSVGNSFPSYDKLMEEISALEKENFVNVSKKHSKTIQMH